MKLFQPRDNSIGSESQQSFGFKIEANAKTFQMMMGSLYTNPIEAFVRELGTNAYEAHQMLNKEDIPFQVTLPTMMHPSFIIRDFGPGLSIDDVSSLYTVLMKSSKEGSNELGGCFGLGSKSPFAYTSNFGIISRHNGKKYCYTVCKGVNGLPKMDLMHSEDTDEESGLEISIPIQTSDIYNISNVVNNTYFWFKTRPTITNGEYKPNLEITEEREGFRYVSGLTGPHAQMGNIIYRLDVNQVELAEFEHINCVIDFAIGDLTPTPSRDGLQYDVRTVANIEKIVGDIIAREKALIQKEIDSKPTYLEACRHAITQHLFSFRRFKWQGKELVDNISRIDSTYQYYDWHGSWMCKRAKGYNSRLSVNNEFKFFYLEDTKKPLVRIEAYLNSINAKKCIVIFNYNKEVVKKKTWARKTVTKAELALEHKITEAEVIEVNTLPIPKVEREKAGSRAGLKEFRFSSHKWDAMTEAKAKAASIDYYCELKDDMVYYEKRSIPNEKLQRLIVVSNFHCNKSSIYGLNQAIIRKHDTTQYKNFIDEQKDFMIREWSIAVQKRAAANLANVVEQSELQKLVGKLPKDISDVLEEYKRAKAILQCKNNYSALEELIKVFWPEEKLVPPRNKFDAKTKNLLDKYPMLKYSHGVPAHELIKYLELVDKA